MAENLNAFQAEIKELEAKLEAKKREMASAGTEAPEQHVFKAVIREHTGHEASMPHMQTAAAQSSASNVATTKPSADDEQKIDDLVMHAFTKGITSAVHEARKMNSPYLVDMLHDRLADEYYQKLLEARKLNTD